MLHNVRARLGARHGGLSLRGAAHFAEVAVSATKAESPKQEACRSPDFTGPAVAGYVGRLLPRSDYIIRHRKVPKVPQFYTIR